MVFSGSEKGTFFDGVENDQNSVTDIFLGPYFGWAFSIQGLKKGSLFGSEKLTFSKF